MYKDIDSYGIIGDLHTVALMGNDGSIDFMCWPDFDSPTLFAALLDDKKGGSFKIAPVWDGETTTKQIYLPDTNILFTRFLSDDGVAEICDYMPVGKPEFSHKLVRRLKTVRGEIKYKLHCEPKFNYGLSRHKTSTAKEGIVFECEEKDGLAVILRSDLPLQIRGGAAHAEFVLKAGQTLHFILEDYKADRDFGWSADHIQDIFETTIRFWRQWIRRSNYQGRWREIVNRSALILKLLTSEKYGSMVASPTFGLPEVIGGPRNWDYRYTWIRDTCFTLNVLMRLGYMEECGAFMQWIEARCAQLKDDDSLQIMYGIDGRQDLTEKDLTHWEGYKKSHPVHIGNEASHQIQLDIYGELMEAVYLYNKHHPIAYHFWENLVKLMEWLCRNWQRPDKGIWEIRGPDQSFLYSKVMCWTALDKAVKLAIERSFPAPLDKWIKLRDEINVEIRRDYWNPERQAFTQFKGSDAMDASSLIMPKKGFIGDDDPLWVSTLKAIEDELVDDSHVYRYRVEAAADDGLPGQEGTFCMCTFWYVECLARAGRLNQARFYFEKMLGYSNHLGLFPEELGLKGQGLGNFPQAFTHLSLIDAAFELDHRLNLSEKVYP
jgi:GH15 family glucan-1,4-alpha-glucosidase